MSDALAEESLQRDTLQELLGASDNDKLARYAAGLHPADIAAFLDSIDDTDHKIRLFSVLDAPLASEVAREAGGLTRDLLLENLSDTRLSAIVEHLDTDDATDLLAELDATRQRELLKRTSPDTRRDIVQLLAYDDDTAGGIMKTEVAQVVTGTTVREITEYLRREGELFHDIHGVFVTDAGRHLVGAIPLRTLILSDDSTPAELMMDTDIVPVRVDIDQEEVARLFEKYDLIALPVVDDLDRLVGRITVDDIVDVISEEATEDMLRMAGVSAETVAIEGPVHGVRSRLPWLTLNLLTASVSAITIAMFEGTIQLVAIAAALMTMVASQGGNAGVQTMTLVVRGLALGEFEPEHVVKILRREIVIAALNGVFLGAIAGVAVYLWRHDLALSLVLGSAMLINLVIAALLGSLVPLGLKRLNIDPAVSSSVFVTAGTDVLGFFVFLGLLTLVL